jgi:hypothetical protein
LELFALLRFGEKWARSRRIHDKTPRIGQERPVLAQRLLYGAVTVNPSRPSVFEWFHAYTVVFAVV